MGRSPARLGIHSEDLPVMSVEIRDTSGVGSWKLGVAFNAGLG